MTRDACNIPTEGIMSHWCKWMVQVSTELLGEGAVYVVYLSVTGIVLCIICLLMGLASPSFKISILCHNCHSNFLSCSSDVGQPMFLFLSYFEGVTWTLGEHKTGSAVQTYSYLVWVQLDIWNCLFGVCLFST